MIFKILSIVIYSMIDFNNWTIINYECIIKLTSKKYVHNSPRNSTLWGLSMIYNSSNFSGSLGTAYFFAFFVVLKYFLSVDKKYKKSKLPTFFQHRLQLNA